MIHPSVLNVLPNPWCALDGEGRPAGAYPVDPDTFGMRYIGARIAQAQVESLTREQIAEGKKTLVAPRQKITWEFTTEPVAIRTNGDAFGVLRKAVGCGELFTADEATARALGVRHQNPAKALAAAKEAARARFDAMHGAGTFDRLARERGDIDEPPAAAAPKAAKAPSKE